MSSILPLGYKFNLGRNANGGTNRVSFRDASAYTFVVDTPANSSTITLTEANATSGGTSQALGGGTAAPVGAVALWTQTAGVWTSVALVAGTNYTVSTGVITLSGTPDLAVVEVNQGALSDGFAYFQAVHSAKVGLYIACDLDVRRKPSNLRNLYA